MKFLSIYHPDSMKANTPPTPELMAEMGRLVEEMMKAGVLLSTGGLLPVSKGGARVRSSAGEISVLDGPFVETKELTAGFAVLQTKSREEALEVARRFLKLVGDGECELRQMMVEPEQAAANA
jgi:hypothetical protein